MKHLAFMLALGIIGLTACKNSATTSKSSDPRTNPETAVTDMIRLLEQKDYKQFIEHYFDPETLQRILGMYSMDEFVENFASKDSKNVDKILSALKMAEKISPELNDDKTEARYPKDQINAGRDILLGKVGEYWYLKN